MEELREKLYEAIEEYGATDERTIAITQELDKIVCEAYKLIEIEGLDYIEAIEKAKELIGSERVGAHVNSDSINSKANNDSISLDEDIDNGEIYNIKTGVSVKEL